MKDNSKVFIYDQGHFTCVKSHREKYGQRERGGEREIKTKKEASTQTEIRERWTREKVKQRKRDRQ